MNSLGLNCPAINCPSAKKINWICSYRFMSTCFWNFLWRRQRTDNDHVAIGCRNFLRTGKRTHNHLHTFGGEERGDPGAGALFSGPQIPVGFGIRFWRDFFAAPDFDYSIFVAIWIRWRVTWIKKKTNEFKAYYTLCIFWMGFQVFGLFFYYIFKGWHPSGMDLKYTYSRLPKTERSVWHTEPNFVRFEIVWFILFGSLGLIFFPLS